MKYCGVVTEEDKRKSCKHKWVNIDGCLLCGATSKFMISQGEQNAENETEAQTKF